MSDGQKRRASASLQQLAEQESAWLSQKEQRRKLLDHLDRCGWVTRQSSWQESLKLAVEPALIERWLGDDRPYRKALEATGADSETAVSDLRHELRRQRGRHLPQSLRHWRIEGQLT